MYVLFCSRNKWNGTTWTNFCSIMVLNLCSLQIRWRTKACQVRAYGFIEFISIHCLCLHCCSLLKYGAFVWTDLVLLNKRTAAEIRTTLRVMLTDSERRQQLIQELIKSNNQLKWVSQKHWRGEDWGFRFSLKWPKLTEPRNTLSSMLNTYYWFVYLYSMCILHL